MATQSFQWDTSNAQLSIRCAKNAARDAQRAVTIVAQDASITVKMSQWKYVRYCHSWNE